MNIYEQVFVYPIPVQSPLLQTLGLRAQSVWQPVKSHPFLSIQHDGSNKTCQQSNRIIFRHMGTIGK